jgi:hypothetical protein
MIGHTFATVAVFVAGSVGAGTMFFAFFGNTRHQGPPATISN